jgi:hypothetical protein
MSGLQQLIFVSEEKLSFGIDEPPDQPWTSDAIDFDVLASDPLH